MVKTAVRMCCKDNCEHIYSTSDHLFQFVSLLRTNHMKENNWRCVINKRSDRNSLKVSLSSSSKQLPHGVRNSSKSTVLNSNLGNMKNMSLRSELCALTRKEKVNFSERISTVKKTLTKRQQDQILMFLAREVTFEL